MPKTVKLWSHIVTTLAHMDHFQAESGACEESPRFSLALR